MATVTICFTLDDRADREVIQWLARLPKGRKSAAIREALHGHLFGNGVMLADVYQAVLDIDRRLAMASVNIGSTTEDEPSSEPPDVVAALDKLGL